MNSDYVLVISDYASSILGMGGIVIFAIAQYLDSKLRASPPADWYQGAGWLLAAALIVSWIPDIMRGWQTWF